MMNFNGASTAPLDPSQLPYATCGGAGPRWLIPIAIAASVLMEVFNLTDFTSIPLAFVLAPPLLLALHVLLFTSIRNAVFIALSSHTHNVRLDAAVEISRLQNQRGQLSPERVAAVTQGRSA